MPLDGPQMRRRNGENRPAPNSHPGWRFRRSLNFCRDTQGNNFTPVNDQVAQILELKGGHGIKTLDVVAHELLRTQVEVTLHC